MIPAFTNIVNEKHVRIKSYYVTENIFYILFMFAMLYLMSSDGKNSCT